MQAYKNRNNGRGSTACGYCRQTGHIIGDCPHIKYDHDEWAAFRVPVHGSACQTCRWFLSDYSYWKKQVEKYYPKFVAAQEKRLNKSKPRASQPQVIRSCGFCGETGHTRRNCATMTDFTTKLNTANANFRQSYYDTLVKELGLGIGAAVKVIYRSGNYGKTQAEEKIGIIDEFDLSSLNIFSVNGKIDNDYRGVSTIMVSVGNERFRLGLGSIQIGSSGHSVMIDRKDSQGRTLCRGGGGYYWNQVFFEGTVAASTKPIDESWVSSGAMANEFEWLTKKRSHAWLEERSIIDLVERWQ